MHLVTNPLYLYFFLLIWVPKAISKKFGRVQPRKNSGGILHSPKTNMAAAENYDLTISFNLVIFMHPIALLLMSYGQVHVP